MSFHMGNRLSREYYVCDLLSDLLSNGRSSRLIRSLVQEQQLFSSVDAYIQGSIDEGLLQISGKLSEGISLEEGEAAVWKELERLKTIPVTYEELEKVKNRYEAEQIFSNMNYLNVANNLAFFELLGNAGRINEEVGHYRSITAEEIRETATRLFVPENSNILYYQAQA